MSVNPGALPGWFNRRSSDPQPANTPPDDTPPTDETVTPAAQTKSGGGKDDQTPVVVWEAANRMEAEVVAGRLHSEGIPAIIRGESLGAIYGLTTGSLAAATVLVPRPLAEKAIALLANSVEWDDAEVAAGDDPPDSDVADSDVADAEAA
jgi:hypothetical protein